MTNPFLQFTVDTGQVQQPQAPNPFLQFTNTEPTARNVLAESHQSRQRLADELKRQLANPDIDPERRERLERLIKMHGPADMIADTPGDFIKNVATNAATSWLQTGLAAADFLTWGTGLIGGMASDTVHEATKTARDRIAEAQAGMTLATGQENAGMVDQFAGAIAGGLGAVGAGAKVGQMGGKAADIAGGVMRAPYEMFARPAQAILRAAPGKIGEKAITGPLAARVVGQTLADVPVNVAQALSIPDATSEEMRKSLGLQTLATAIGATVPVRHAARPDAPKVDADKAANIKQGNIDRAVELRKEHELELLAKKQWQDQMAEASKQARNEWIAANPSKEWKSQTAEYRKAVVGAWMLEKRPDLLTRVKNATGPEPATTEMRSLEEVIAERDAQILRLQGENRGLQRAAYTDELTGLQNRNAFEAMASRLGGRDVMDGYEVTYFDVANLGHRNNLGGAGHTGGDAVLAYFGELTRNVADMHGIESRNLFRLGGDEFAAVVPIGKGNDFAKDLVKRFGRDPIGDSGIDNYIRYGIGRNVSEADAAVIREKQVDKHNAKMQEQLTRPVNPAPDIAPKGKPNDAGYQRLMDDLLAPDTDPRRTLRSPDANLTPDSPASDLRLTPESRPEAHTDPRSTPPDSDLLITREQIEKKLDDTWTEIQKFPEGQAPPELYAEVTRLGQLANAKESLDRTAINGYPNDPLTLPVDPAAPQRVTSKAPAIPPRMQGAEFRKLFQTPEAKLSNADASRLYEELHLQNASRSQKDPDMKPYFDKEEALRNLLMDRGGMKLHMRGEIVAGVGGFVYGWSTASEDEHPLVRGGLFGLGGTVLARRLQLARHKAPQSPIPKHLLSKVKMADEVRKRPKQDNMLQHMRSLYTKYIGFGEGLYGLTKPLRLNPIDDPGFLIETFGRHIGQANEWQSGKPFIYEYDGSIRELNIRSLHEIGNHVEFDLDGLGKLAASLSAIERATLGKPVTGIDLNEAMSVVALSPAKYHEAAVWMRQYHEGLLDVAVTAGIIRPEDKAVMTMEKFYTTLERYFDSPEAPIYVRKQDQLTHGNPLKKRKGPTPADIKNPFEAMINNTARMLRAAEISQVQNKLMDLVEANPDYFARQVKRVDRNTRDPNSQIPYFDPNTQARVDGLKAELGITTETAERMAAAFGKRFLNPTDPTMTMYRDGHIRTYRMDPIVANSFRALYPAEIEAITDAFGMAAPAMTASIKAASFARGGIVNNPVFIGYQFLVRDAWQAAVNSQYGFNPLTDNWKGLYQIMSKSKMYHEYVRAGGGHQALAHGDVWSLKRGLEHVKSGQPTKIGDATQRLKEMKPFEAWKELTIPFAEAARMGEYMKARGAGASPIEAAYASKNVGGNFQQHGTKMRALNMMTMFLNPAIRAMDQAVYTAGIHPVRGAPAATGASRVRNATQAAAEAVGLGDRAAAAMAYGLKNMTMIGIPTALLYIANKDDQEIQDLRQTEAGSRFWFTRVNGELIKIPKPIFEGQVFGTSMEVALDNMRGKDDMGFERWARAIENDIGMNILPTLGVVAASMYGNRDMNFGSPITNPTSEGLSPQYQINPSTTGPSRVVGKWLSPISDWFHEKSENVPFGVGDALARAMSPAGLDYLVRNLGGTLRQEALYGLGKAIEMQTNPTYVPPGDEWPIIRRALVKYPTMAVQPVADFYEFSDRYDKISRNAAWLAKHDPVGLVDYMQKNATELALGDLYRRARTNIADMRAQYTNMQMAPAGMFKPQDIRDFQDEITRLIIELARSANTVRTQVQ